MDSSKWEKAKLIDICTPKQWKTISKKDMLSKGYVVYGAGGMIGYTDKYNHEEETVIVGCRGTCGNVIITEKFSYINGNAMALDNLKEEVINKNYLAYYLKSKGFNEVITGTTQKQITREGLSKYYVEFPQIDEQIKIVKILERAEKVLEKKKEVIRLVDELVKSTFIDMFGDPVTNSFNNDIRELKELAKLERGKFTPRPRNDPRYFNGEFPFIQTGDISRCNYRLYDYSSTLNEEGIKVSKKFERGVIVIALVGATIGMTAILQREVYATDSIVGITTVDSIINSVFLEMVLRAWREPLLNMAPEAARANINIGILEKLPIIIPDIEEQNKFCLFVEKIYKLKSQMEESLKEMENNFNSLIQSVFKGELFN